MRVNSIEALMLTFMISLLVWLCSCYRYAYRTFVPFPFDPELNITEKRTISNGDSVATVPLVITLPTSSTTTCVDNWMADGNCDQSNNNALCNYDGGDCCRQTCVTNCATKSCQFTCGQTNPYDCIDPNAGCQSCTHGTCNTGSNCLTSDTSVNLAIAVCILIPWSMGNGSTIDYYCGRDLTCSISYDSNDPTKHYPGCGFTYDQCTAEACCENIQTAISAGEPMTFEEIRTCFQTNMMSRGQCCECDDGWTGYSCNVPVCDPACQMGTCIDKDVCECYTGWEGSICQQAICKDCQKGNCIAPDVCECFYGYIYSNCSTPTHSIGCDHGVVSGVDLCTCDAGWIGEICDTPTCTYSCNNGWCKDLNYCECKPMYESSSPTSLCDRIKCEYFDTNCYSCDNSGCTACVDGYYYSSTDLMCRSCSINYDSNCVVCDSTKCLSCSYPRVLKTISGVDTCITYGVIEFTNRKLIVLENEQQIIAYIRRSYGTYGQVSIDYKYNVDDIQIVERKSSNECVFADGVDECEISINIFETPYMLQTEFIVKITLFNPQGGAILGPQDYMEVHIYDIDIADSKHSYALLDGSYSSDFSYNIVIGQNYTLSFYDYVNINEIKTDGSDIFFVYIMRQYFDYTSNSFVKELVNIVRSFYDANEVYNATYMLTKSYVNMYDLYASVPGCIYATFYETIDMFDPPYIQRVLSIMPQQFTEDTSFERISVLFETVLIAPQAGRYSFFVYIAQNTKVDFKINGNLIKSLSNSLSCSSYYNNTQCCSDTLFQISDNISYKSGDPLLLQMNYYHTIGSSCIAVFYQNIDISGSIMAPLSGEYFYAPIKMQQTGFQISPVLDVTLIDLTSINWMILIGSTSMLVSTCTLANSIYTVPSSVYIQVGYVNTIRLVIEDIYGNEFSSNSVIFYMEMTPTGQSTQIFISKYNDLQLSYEFYVTPTFAADTKFKIYESQTLSQIKCSPLLLTVIPGIYDPSKFTLSYSDTAGVCYIAVECNIIMTIFDSYGNIIKSGNAFSLSLIDSYLNGPKNKSTLTTIKITSITENIGSGTYSFKFTVYKSGFYDIFTRIGIYQIQTYPFEVEAVSNQASAPKSIILEDPLTASVAGKTITLTLYIQDEYGNLSVDDNIPIKATMSLNTNLNLTATITKVSTGIYLLQFQPTVAGNYTMSIQILDQTESYGYIKNMPQTQVVIPDYISISHSTYSGSGLISGRFGFIETFILTVKDKYDNNYNKQYTYYNGTNNLVYQIDFKANDADEIDVLTVSSDPTNGQYTIGYLIINAYSTLYVRIWLFVTTDNGVTYSYQQVLNFPIIVQIVFSPSDLMDQYTNLYQGGIGITDQSNTNITNSVVVGAGLTKFMEFYPQNAYNLTYLHDESRDYLIIDMYTDIADECLCQRYENFNSQKLAMSFINKTSLSFSLKNCFDLSYSPTYCNLAGICEWKLQASQNINYNNLDCAPRICDSCPGIDVQNYEKPRNELTKVINGYLYNISGSFTKSGIYKVYTSVISMGLLKVVVYKSSNFTYQAFETFINWVDIGMNSTFNSYFSTKTLSYSMKISGLLTCLVSDTVMRKKKMTPCAKKKRALCKKNDPLCKKNEPR